MWLLESDIENLLSVPQLKVDVFTINYNTNHDWVVTTPEGEQIMFKKDTGKCKVFPFIEMCSQEALEFFHYVSKVDTFRGDYEGFTKKDV